jgi:hypothetical protein
MKGSVYVSAAGLSLVMLLPLAAAAQGVPPQTRVPDPTGDVQGTAGPMQGQGPAVTLPGPGYLDITALHLEREGSDLVATFGLAAAILEHDPAVDEVVYALYLRPDAGTYLGIETRRSSGWLVESIEYLVPPGGQASLEDGPGAGPDPEVTDHGMAERSGSRLVLRVPLPDMSTLDGVQFFASATAVRDCSLEEACTGFVATGEDPGATDVPFVWWRTWCRTAWVPCPEPAGLSPHARERQAPGAVPGRLAQSGLGAESGALRLSLLLGRLAERCQQDEDRDLGQGARSEGGGGSDRPGEGREQLVTRAHGFPAIGVMAIEGARIEVLLGVEPETDERDQPGCERERLGGADARPAGAQHQQCQGHPQCSYPDPDDRARLPPVAEEHQLERQPGDAEEGEDQDADPQDPHERPRPRIVPRAIVAHDLGGRHP